jgi:hypothetical protein
MPLTVRPRIRAAHRKRKVNNRRAVKAIVVGAGIADSQITITVEDQGNRIAGVAAQVK